MTPANISRRDLLKAGGALVISFMLPGTVETAFGQASGTIGGRPPLTPDELDSWIAVLPDGTVTAFFGKMDMGQGVDVAIGQIVADELDVAFDRVKVVMGDTAFSCNQCGACGALEYVADVKCDGLLAARLIGLPTAGGGPVAIDESAIAGIPGARVVREKDLVSVVAEREWDAVRAARALKVTWAPPCTPFPEMAKLHDHIRQANAIGAEVPVKKGDVDAALKTAHRVIEAEYEWPLQSHASMGPACAVADVRADQATLWTGSQKPHYGRNGVAKLVGLPPEKVRAVWVPGPGSYGRNDAGDAALDAALLSKLAGRPVRVQYMRHAGTGWEPKGPAAVYRARAGLDAQGTVVAYDFLGKGFTRQDVATTESDPKDTLAGQLTGYAPKPTVIFQVPAEAYA